MTLFLVMAGRIFAKFDIAPKAQLSSEHFETCSVQYGYRTLQVVFRICHIIDLRPGQFRDLPIRYKSMGKNQVSQIPIRSLQINQNDEEYG